MLQHAQPHAFRLMTRDPAPQHATKFPWVHATGLTVINDWSPGCHSLCCHGVRQGPVA